MDNAIDKSKLRYVLYARKSTNDPQRQVRSIGDQVTECHETGFRLGLNIVEVLQEKKSAKKPNQRPIFTKMLEDIRSGKYDAIIAWHPDRLARNMKEGGEIIDMVDEGQIKDMVFVMHHFSKDANGKMLLGMAFVLSKQYSDNLSQNVTRGVRRNLNEGKASNPKHGYIRDENGFQVPDGKNFSLLRKAWEMKINGSNHEEIASTINKQGYARIIKSTQAHRKKSR